MKTRLISALQPDSLTHRRRRTPVPLFLDDVLAMPLHALRRGPYYIIGQDLPDAYRALLRREEPAWMNEYTNRVVDKDEAGEQRLRENLRWLCEALGTSLDRVGQSHFVPPGVVLTDLAEADVYWERHLELISTAQPDVIITYGISDISPFWYLYEHSDALGDTWDHIPAGHGNWRCKAFTGSFGGRRIPVVGLPHLSRYRLSGKTQVIDWIKAKRVLD